MAPKSSIKHNRAMKPHDFLARLRPMTRNQKKRCPDWKPLNGYHPDVWASNQRQMLSSDCHPFYDVEEIIDQRVSILGERKYKVRWLGYGPSEDSWEPADHLYCPQKLIEFFDCRTKEESMIDDIKQEPIEIKEEPVKIKDKPIEIEREPVEVKEENHDQLVPVNFAFSQ